MPSDLTPPNLRKSRASEYAFTIRCPICRERKGLDREPQRGLYVLCDGCLGVLQVDVVHTAAGSGLGVRALEAEDMDRIPSDVELAILEIKMRRLRECASTGRAVSERPASDIEPTLLDRTEGR